MQTQIRKWGNSAALRIPATILEAADLKPDATVNIREEDRRIIIEAAHPRRCRLDSLLAGITKDNLHGEVSFGDPAGREAL